MITLNRGEWSELYCVLFLLIKPKIEIVDENMNKITSELFEIKKIIADTNFPLEYEIINDRIIVYAVKDKIKSYTKKEIDKYRNELYKKIINNTSVSGSFSIESIEEFLRDFSLGQVLKAKNVSKEDIEVIAYDNKRKSDINLKYSIKSSLGSPATLLNSSNHTNFKYRVIGMNDDLMKEVNSIDTRTKLLDRLNIIYNNNCSITYDSVVSDNFLYNLKMIDSSMDKYIANTLLYSYKNNNKILKDIFISANSFDDVQFAEKKLGDFLSAISFGFFPGTKWNGENVVNGGLLIVTDEGNVVVLDLVYYENTVRKYLINNTQLDSPSSTRYHMLEVFKDNDEYYFTLNLQVRYTRNFQHNIDT